MLKRMFDLLSTSVALIILCIPMLLISLIIRLKMGSPVIFKHTRPGLNARPFVLYKFRTMSNLRDENGELLPEEQRLTKFGNFLRKFSLDELPELINIIKGEMSLVGPRPLLMQYVPLYNDEQNKRHVVKPGLTGWAQVHGRNAVSWEKKFELDVWYVRNRTFLLDLKIIILTLKTVLSREGINDIEDKISFPFTGSKEQNETHNHTG